MVQKNNIILERVDVMFPFGLYNAYKLYFSVLVNALRYVVGHESGT